MLLTAGLLIAAATVPAASGTPIATLHFADAEERLIALDAPGVLYLVDFWALECKPCMQEMPELASLAGEYEPSGRFKLVSVVFGDWKGKGLLEVARRTGTGITAYSDPENWYERLQVEGFPTKLLIRDGRVIVRELGGGTGAYEAWKAEIDRLIPGKVAPKQP